MAKSKADLSAAWEAAGSPELAAEEEEEVEIPLETDDDEGIPVEDELDPEGDTPESGTPSTWPEDLPKSYFGKDIEAYAKEHGVEAAKVYHGALKDATKDVNRWMEQRAEERKAAAQATPVEQDPAEELDADELLRGLGIDASDPIVQEIRDSLVTPLAKRLAQLENASEANNTKAQADAFEQEFFKGLEAAAAKFGEPLPAEFDRETLLDRAISTDTYDPENIYLGIMGPVWKFEKAQQSDVANKATKTAAEAAKRAKVAASRAKGRRSSSPSVTDVSTKKGMTMEEAAKAAARQHGKSVVKF